MEEEGRRSSTTHVKSPTPSSMSPLAKKHPALSSLASTQLGLVSSTVVEVEMQASWCFCLDDFRADLREISAPLMEVSCSDDHDRVSIGL